MAGSPLERLRSRARKGFRGYPIATVAFYGPTNEVASKVAVSTISSDGAEAEVVGRWYNTELDVRHDPVIGTAIVDALAKWSPRSVVVTQGIIGCPHEEGIDYPVGEQCPRCPFWANRDRWRDA